MGQPQGMSPGDGAGTAVLCPPSELLGDARLTVKVRDALAKARHRRGHVRVGSRGLAAAGSAPVRQRSARLLIAGEPPGLCGGHSQHGTLEP
jgi:hypothetical protein